MRGGIWILAIDVDLMFLWTFINIEEKLFELKIDRMKN
jgi:hypothetical protein